MIGMRIYFLSIFIIYSAVLWRFKKRTDRIIQEVEEAAHDLGLLAGVLRRLEAERFASARLTGLRAELEIEGQPPSRRIARRNRLIVLLDSRHNQIFGVIAPLLLWISISLTRSKTGGRTSGPAMRRWLNAVGEMEAISSLASFGYEYPRYVFPEFVAESPYLEGEALGHPLLGTDGVVPNDVRIGGDPRVLVVSGLEHVGQEHVAPHGRGQCRTGPGRSAVRARRLRLSPWPSAHRSAS